MLTFGPLTPAHRYGSNRAKKSPLQNGLILQRA